MPEIAEVARVAHFLRTHLKNRKIAKVLTQEDTIVYGKVGTSASEFQKALTGRTILDAKTQGKYFWLECDKAPHPLMHLGMTGWVKLSNVETGYYKPKKDGKKVEDTGDAPEAVYNNAGSTRDGQPEWPPKFYKFVLQMEGEPKIEAAFIDARRLGRIRLVDVPAADMRTTTPLRENGPDPVIDKDKLTLSWLQTLLKTKRSPIKAVLLDQANISGIGNWVGDEILYNARIHPEQYSNTLTDDQCKQLHDSLIYVCGTACNVLGDSDQYPDDWLFKYRWNKSKKAASVLPSGEKIAFVTVGGRTSAYIPTLQKKTGPVAGDAKEVANVEDEVKQTAKTRSMSGSKSLDGDVKTEVETPKKAKRGRVADGKAAPVSKKQKVKAETVKPEVVPNGDGRRSSTRSKK